MKNKYIKTIFSLIFIAFLSFIIILPQINSHYVFLGDDSIFHFNRIYDIAEQLKTHNFNLFQVNYGLNQTGRIVNVVYGPYLSVLLGSLLYLVHNWLWFEICSSFLLLILAGIGMSLVMKELKINFYISIIIISLFLTSKPLNLWYLNQEFTGWGVALIPYVLFICIKILKNNNLVNFIILALILALLVECHFVTTLISISLVIIFILIAFKKSNKKIKFLKNIFISLIIFLCLTANYWGALLIILLSNKIIPPFANYFMGRSTINILNVTNFSSNNGLGIVISIILIFQLIYIILGHANKLNILLTLLSLLLFFISSNFCPWDYFAKYLPIIRRGLQFPTRFIPFAIVLLLLALSMSLTNIISTTNKIKKLLLGLILIILAFLSLYQIHILTNQKVALSKTHSNKPISLVAYSKYYLTNSKVNNAQIQKTFNNPKSLTPAIKLINDNISDYLPNYYSYPLTMQDRAKNSPFIEYTNQIIKPSLKEKFHKSVNNNGALVVKWQEKSKKDTSLPIVIYNNSIINFNHHIISPKSLKISSIGVPTINSKPGENKLILNYLVPNWYWILITISTLGWIIIVIWLIYIFLFHKL